VAGLTKIERIAIIIVSNESRTVDVYEHFDIVSFDNVDMITV